MCGICGRLELDRRRPGKPRLVEAMSRVMAHRGPDDAGLWSEGPIALGHRRLSIIDLAEGHQPLSNPSGSVQVVFNGEIYNFEELRTQLIAMGYTFRTESDTEVLVHGYEAWETRLPEMLRGMFAFAIWDVPAQSLFLARDRLGIKPLFWARGKSGFLSFASEVRAFHVDPDVDLSIDPVAIDSYLALQYVPDPFTGLQGIRQLPPGHAMLVDGKGPRTWEYWDAAEAPEITNQPDIVHGLRHQMREAVRYHLVSDVPVGSFLSGGLDSGVVTAFMAMESSEPPTAVTIGFKDGAMDERNLAAEVAELYGCHHSVHLLDMNAVETFDAVMAHLDEPFGDWSALPTYLVSRAARQDVKVILSGDGGDELFGGYARHRVQRAENLVRLLSDRLPAAVLNALIDAYPHSAPGAASLEGLRRTPPRSIARKHAHGFFDRATLRRDVAGPRLREELPPEAVSGDLYAEPFERAYERAGRRGDLDAALYMELKTYLPGDILRKTDRMSMAHSLEARVPFLDHPLVELAVAVPARRKVGWRRGKLVFREAFSDLLPGAIWKQPKRGFDIPAGRWLRTVLRDRCEEVLFSPQADARGWWDPETVRRLWQEHLEGRDHSRRLWALLAMEGWRRNLDEARASTAVHDTRSGGTP